MIEKFLLEKPTFFKESPVNKDVWAKVREQAIGHTQRLSNDPILTQMRPNEDKITNEYRNNNRRLITKGDVIRFCYKTSRIFEQSGVILKEASPTLTEWLDTEPFHYLGMYSSLNEYQYRVVLPEAIEDPNALLVVFPYNENNPDIPPNYPISEGGKPPNQPIDIDVYIVPSDAIKYMDKHLFGWKAGMWKVDDKTEEPFYYFADKFYYYRVYPVWREVEGRKVIRYEYEVWYFHNSGFLPLNVLPGIMSKSEKKEWYNESILHGYFEPADEFKSRFSDNQAITVQHAHPKVIISQMPCPEKSCISGKITMTDKSGNPYKETCKSCNGKGYIIDPGPYGVLVDADKSGLDTGNRPEPYRIITPPVEGIRTSYDNAWDILTKARKQIGLDLLVDGSESGLAKAKRLEDLQDMYISLSGVFIDTIEMMLLQIECLLQIDPNKRIDPVIYRPDRFNIKDESDLYDDFNNALPFDKLATAMQLINQKYKGDRETVRKYEIAFRYMPELLLTEDEFRLRVAAGLIETTRATQRDYVMIALNQIETENKTDEKIIEELESKITELAPSAILPGLAGALTL